MISSQVGKPLNIKLPHVYRYMDKKYIDLFFNEGKLRLSSFEKFRNYPDEIRGDKSEGGGFIVGKSQNNNSTMGLLTKVGQNGYMLSTSLMNSKKLKDEFETDDVFIIKDPLKFAVSVSSAILGNEQVYIGFCNYQKERIIYKVLESLSPNDLLNDNNKIVIGGESNLQKKLFEIVGNGIDLMYLKSSKYQNQSEFRFVWTIKSQYFDMKNEIDIECKEAIQFCERVT